MVVKDFFSKTVFLDTAPLIYFIEGHSRFQSILSDIFRRNNQGEFQFISSPITILEVLVKPLKDGQMAIANQYKTILSNASEITIMDFTVIIAQRAAELRAKYNLRTPDSIQLSTAIEFSADYFLTNDTNLKSVVESKVITLDDIL